MNLSPKIKNVLWIVFAVVLVGVFIVWFQLDPIPEHIEDTNGADNYNLQTITEQDILGQKIGVRGTLSQRETHLDIAGVNISSGVRYSSKKFTGVSLLHASTVFKGSDIYVTLAEFEIKEGNFAFYIIFDDEIIGKIIPSDSAYSEFLLKNVEKTGAVQYVIAGESASFEFVLPIDFD